MCFGLSDAIQKKSVQNSHLLGVGGIRRDRMSIQAIWQRQQLCFKLLMISLCGVVSAMDPTNSKTDSDGNDAVSEASRVSLADRMHLTLPEKAIFCV